jgi:hypothetical protein
VGPIVSAWLTAGELAAGLAAATTAWRTSARTLKAAAPPRITRAFEAGPGPGTTLARARHATGARLAGDVHVVLRPVLQEIAIERLHARGVDLFSDATAARELLGDALWDLVRPERPPPPDRLARALELRELSLLVDRLEAI